MEYVRRYAPTTTALMNMSGEERTTAFYGPSSLVRATANYWGKSDELFSFDRLEAHMKKFAGDIFHNHTGIMASMKVKDSENAYIVCQTTLSCDLGENLTPWLHMLLAYNAYTQCDFTPMGAIFALRHILDLITVVGPETFFEDQNGERPKVMFPVYRGIAITAMALSQLYRILPLPASTKFMLELCEIVRRLKERLSICTAMIYQSAQGDVDLHIDYEEELFRAWLPDCEKADDVNSRDQLLVLENAKGVLAKFKQYTPWTIS